jgi:hypothetical protein
MGKKATWPGGAKWSRREVPGGDKWSKQEVRRTITGHNLARVSGTKSQVRGIKKPSWVWKGRGCGKRLARKGEVGGKKTRTGSDREKPD